MKPMRRLLVCLLVVGFVPFAQATMPSSASIDIEPITYNDDGVVLFRAHKHIDYTGATSGQNYSYWWLAVSANGVWDEVLYVELKDPGENLPKGDLERYLMQTHRYGKEFFENDFSWTQPPHSVLPLIKKYAFKPRPGFDKNEGQGAVTWSSKGICLHGKCTQGPVPQRTLGNKVSSKANTRIEFEGKEMIDVEGPPVSCVFYHAGIALFRNGNYKIVDGKYEATDRDPIGADFDFDKGTGAGQMIDYHYIDAISILPRELYLKR